MAQDGDITNILANWKGGGGGFNEPHTKNLGKPNEPDCPILTGGGGMQVNKVLYLFFVPTQTVQQPRSHMPHHAHVRRSTHARPGMHMQQCPAVLGAHFSNASVCATVKLYL